jgi:hypothetical protein
MAYPEGRVNNEVTNFELHEVLLKLATNFHRKFLVLALLIPFKQFRDLVKLG